MTCRPVSASLSSSKFQCLQPGTADLPHVRYTPVALALPFVACLVLHSALHVLRIDRWLIGSLALSKRMSRQVQQFLHFRNNGGSRSAVYKGDIPEPRVNSAVNFIQVGQSAYQPDVVGRHHGVSSLERSTYLSRTTWEVADPPPPCSFPLNPVTFGAPIIGCPCTNSAFCSHFHPAPTA